jgi:hypothetical protein
LQKISEQLIEVGVDSLKLMLEIALLILFLEIFAIFYILILFEELKLLLTLWTQKFNDLKKLICTFNNGGSLLFSIFAGRQRKA